MIEPWGITMADQRLTLEEVKELATEALMGAGASQINAASVAQSTYLAERDGIRSHGLMYVPIYAEHVKCGKVVGDAVPVLDQPRPSAIVVDAANGFAHPAIDAGVVPLMAAAGFSGVAAMTIHNSYNCGVLGHHAERLANEGFVAICFTHAPASIAPTGGNTPVIGTNPFALGVPNAGGGAAFVIDQSASAIAKSEIMLRAREDKPLEPGWAVDRNGDPTINAQAALEGSMLPAGGQKGFGVGLMVEILASCLAGANLSINASPFSGTAGGPPGTGQCFIAIDPEAFSSNAFHNSVTALTEAITTQDGARLPGKRRLNNQSDARHDGVWVPEELVARIKAYI
jgi:(2R)-3-sulfolactate dehydrogenase (NADP+)